MPIGLKAKFLYMVPEIDPATIICQSTEAHSTRNFGQLRSLQAGGDLDYVHVTKQKRHF
jgi:hypothetical protein